MGLFFDCLDGFLLGKAGSQIGLNGVQIAADLLIHIKGTVVSGNLCYLQAFPVYHAGLIEISRNLKDIFHIAVKKILLKLFRIIVHKHNVMDAGQIIHKPLG